MPKSRISFIVWAALFAGSLATGYYVYSYIYKGFREEAVGRFNDEAKSVYANILQKNGLEAYARTLDNLSGLFAASISVERDEFDTFIQTSQYVALFPATESFSYIKRVANTDKNSFVQSVKRDTSIDKNGYPNFSIIPEGTRKEYYVATYIKPYAGNETLLGEDLLADPARQYAIETARDTGNYSVTGLFLHDGKPRFSIVLPIYRNGTLNTTINERREHIIGLVAATINPDIFVAPALNSIDNAIKKIRISTYENDSSGQPVDIYDYKNTSGTQNDLTARSFTFRIGNANWILSITESESNELHPLERLAPYLGGIGIFAIMFLGGGMLALMISARNRAIVTAQELAKNLREVEHHLMESSANITLTIDDQNRLTAMNDAAMRLLGYSLEDVVGIHIGKIGIVATSSLAAAMKAIERVQRGEMVDPVELWLIKRSGALIITEASMTRLHESAEAPEIRITIHDITTRKNAENALARSPAEFKTFADESLDALFIFVDGAIHFTNAKSSSLFKYSEEELRGIELNHATLIARESQQTVKNDMARLMREKTSRESECTFFSKDKSRIYTTISMSRVMWNNKDAILVVARDISARKRLEQRSTMENRIAKTITESAPNINVARQLLEDIAVTFHWQFGDIWMQNQKTNELELFDYWQQPGYDFTAFERRARVLSFKKGVGLPGQVWESGKPKWISSIADEPKFIRGLEAKTSMLNTAFAFPLVVEQTTVGVVEFFTDAKIEELSSELVEAFLSIGATLGQFIKQRLTNDEIRKRNVDLQKYLLAIEWTEDAVVITDEDAIVQYANKAAEKMNGYTRSEMMGQKSGKLWGGLMPKEFYENMWHTIKTLHKPFTSEIRNRRKNGEEYIALVNISPVFDELGVPRFFVATERDITRAKEIDRAKTEFVSLASHQLRTPITAINWYSEILLSGDMGKITKKQRVYLEEIYNGGRRLVMLVNSLLNVSRVELGTFVIQPSPLNPVDICATALKDVELMAEHKSITITKDIAHDIPRMSADAGLMQILFQNLITNAVEYTKDGGRVTITLKKQADDLYFSVADTGIGIPSADQDKIFGKMYRADNARDIKTYGTGLGLYIVKAILDEVGGKIWFESVENKGTTFFMTVPLSGMQPKKGTKMLSLMSEVV